MTTDLPSFFLGGGGARVEKNIKNMNKKLRKRMDTVNIHLQEDRFVVKNLRPDLVYCAVFDGHGGAR